MGKGPHILKSLGVSVEGTLIEWMVTPQMTSRDIIIADEFSKYPAGRFTADGPYSGADFRDNILAPALQDEELDKVVVVFDGVAGFGSSFLEEAFGGLAREHKMERSLLDRKLQLKADDPDLQDYVALTEKYIEDALGKQIG